MQLFDKKGTAISSSTLSASLVGINSQGVISVVNASACIDGQAPAPAIPWDPSAFCEAGAAPSSQDFIGLKIDVRCAGGLSRVQVFNGQQSSTSTDPNSDMVGFELIISWRGLDFVAGGVSSPVFNDTRLEYTFVPDGGPLK